VQWLAKDYTEKMYQLTEESMKMFQSSVLRFLRHTFNINPDEVEIKILPEITVLTFPNVADYFYFGLQIEIRGNEKKILKIERSERSTKPIKKGNLYTLTLADSTNKFRLEEWFKN